MSDVGPRVAPRHSASLMTAAAIVAIAAYALLTALSFSSVARLLPLVIGVPLLGFSLANLALATRDWFRNRGEVTSRGIPDRTLGDTSHMEEEVAIEASERGLNLRFAWLSLIALLIFFTITGLLVTSMLFTFLYLFLIARAKLLTSLLVGLFTLLLIYGMNQYVQVPIYRGLIFS